MDSTENFYFKMSAVLGIAFLIWVFGAPFKDRPTTADEGPKFQLKGTPLAFTNFAPPKLVVFDDSENVLPKRNWSIQALEIQAEAAVAMRPDALRIYYNKNMEVRRPIASLTKLMTAIVVLENYNLNDIIKISEDNIKREGSQGGLYLNEEITVRSLLAIMLISSSNDAASALAEYRIDFILLMNKKASNLGLKNTNFVNADGLDEDGNYSSALDMAKIFSYLINTYPEILDILKTQNMVVYSNNGKIEHRLKNTNELLRHISEVVAGKTGYTDNAGGSLMLLISSLNFGSEENVITVILGSPDRFGESEKLINWLREAYIW
ncbi:MAG: D-alanyl-D-alanine carboxypeptidase [Parcubacteria group bacterium]|nr:D-alanyl-D-alanine carboxypeptidase [Parcubacteria group bacterium]